MTTVSVAAEGTPNFLLPNATIIVEFLLFGIILLVFYRYIVPPLAKAMREREEMIKKQVEDRDDAIRRLRQAEERYEAALAEARSEAAGIRDEARVAAQAIRDDKREQTDREVEQIWLRGEEQLAAQREQAVRQLRTEIGGLSTQLASRILGEQLADGGPQRATVDRFIADLVRVDREKAPTGGVT